jgi:hypothetical protein
MSKKIAIAAALVIGLAFQGAPAAMAGGCVSEKAFAKVKNGMSVSQVAGIFGTNGSRGAYSKVGSYSSEVRSYKTCTPYGSVAVSYMNGAVSAKSGVF